MRKMRLISSLGILPVLEVLLVLALLLGLPAPAGALTPDTSLPDATGAQTAFTQAATGAQASPDTG